MESPFGYGCGLSVGLSVASRFGFGHQAKVGKSAAVGERALIRGSMACQFEELSWADRWSPGRHMVPGVQEIGRELDCLGQTDGAPVGRRLWGEHGSRS